MRNVAEKASGQASTFEELPRWSGVELCDGAMDCSRSLIKRQVENGIAVRMAAPYWLQPDAFKD